MRNYFTIKMDVNYKPEEYYGDNAEKYVLNDVICNLEQAGFTIDIVGCLESLDAILSLFEEKIKDYCNKQIKSRESMENILTLFKPEQRAFNAGAVQSFKEILSLINQEEKKQ